MKKILLLFLLIGQTSLGQEHPIIAFFTAQSSNDQVLLTWNIIGGNNCNGIDIFHSANGVDYDQIGNIPGICGALDEDEPYRFVHEDPAPNQVNYYKLLLGGQGYTTPLLFTFYQTGKDGFTFFPNPSTDNIQLYISDDFQNTSIEIIDMNGKVVYDSEQQSGRLRDISLIDLESGTYIIRMRQDNTLISSKKLIRI